MKYQTDENNENITPLITSDTSVVHQPLAGQLAAKENNIMSISTVLVPVVGMYFGSPFLLYSARIGFSILHDFHYFAYVFKVRKNDWQSIASRSLGAESFVLLVLKSTFSKLA